MASYSSDMGAKKKISVKLRKSESVIGKVCFKLSLLLHFPVIVLQKKVSLPKSTSHLPGVRYELLFEQCMDYSFLDIRLKSSTLL